MATVWLGWSPESAWKATIPEILVAMDAKLELQEATLPTAKKKPEKPKPMSAFIDTISKMPGTKVYGRK